MHHYVGYTKYTVIMNTLPFLDFNENWVSRKPTNNTLDYLQHSRNIPGWQNSEYQPNVQIVEKYNIAPVVSLPFHHQQKPNPVCVHPQQYTIVKMFNSSSCPVKHQLTVDSGSFEMDTSLGSTLARQQKNTQEGPNNN
jgi:hypothetical protein